MKFGESKESSESPKEESDEESLMAAAFVEFADAAGIPEAKRDDAKAALEAFIKCCNDYGDEE